MRKVLCAGLVALLGAALALAGEPAIEGPSQVKAFQLVKLRAVGVPKGAAYLWRIKADRGYESDAPPDVADTAKDVRQWTAAPGRYTVTLFVAQVDGSNNLTLAEYTKAVEILPVPLPPGPLPPPIDPPPVEPGAVSYLLVVRKDGPIDAAYESVMRLPAWNDLRKAGYVVGDMPATEARADYKYPATAPVPGVHFLRLTADRKKAAVAGEPVALPTTGDGIKQLPAKFK